MKSISFLIITLFVFNLSFAQPKTDEKKVKFKVWGNCEMCKKTIESSLDVKGVKSAVWNQDTKMIDVVFNSAKISEDKLYDLIASSGYDTEKKKASSVAYKALPECCQYTRK
jgi:periplasmic mercuric ion binding protein